VAGVVVGAPFLHDLAEGIDRNQLPLWRLWFVLGVALLSAIGLIHRSRRAVCPACGAGPLATPLASEPPATGATRRAVLRATGAATAVTVGGAAGIILPNRGWLRVGATSSARRSRPSRRTRIPRGRRRTSRATAGSAGRT
jgi:hypothetical protein